MQKTLNSDSFYQNLPYCVAFTDYPKKEFYTDLPIDWLVIITDVKGSTVAIEAGRYKEVNALGVASIIAIINAVKPIEIPYVFGGDGATLCIPPSQLKKVKAALSAAREMAKIEFNLDLRVGLVTVEELIAADHEVKLAKYKVSDAYTQTLFWGSGFSYAELLIKSKTLGHKYAVEKNYPADGCFDGFECRWNEIPSPHEKTLSLLVSAHGETETETIQIYQKLNKFIFNTYGDEAHYCPVREEGMSLALARKKLMTETRIRNAFKSPWAKTRYLIKLFFLSLIGKWLMARGVKTADTNWKEYKKTFIANSDFQKFDEMLRMIISGTNKQHESLINYLKREKNKGKLSYGIHLSTHSLTTCLVFNYSKNHLHFLDGSNGGYAMAAKELKRQLSARKN